jgi:hypothetical protein
VIQRLNECFDVEWIFDIQEHRVYDGEIVVLGKLAAQRLSKSEFGKSRITRSKKDNAISSLGDDLKAAATDCLKKCATLFGVGLHLYFDTPSASNGNGSDHSHDVARGDGQHSVGSNGNGSDVGPSRRNNCPQSSPSQRREDRRTNKFATSLKKCLESCRTS